VLAPAFYAQSDAKSPTLAGIISFAVNMVLAALLAFRFKGAGIAFALSFASAVNTALLLFFLKKNPSITLGQTLKSALVYALKMVFFSALAIIPVLFLSPYLTNVFAGRGRFISQGGPLFVNAVVYAVVGILLLALSGDRQIHGILHMLRRRERGA